MKLDRICLPSAASLVVVSRSGMRGSSIPKLTGLPSAGSLAGRVCCHIEWPHTLEFWGYDTVAQLALDNHLNPLLHESSYCEADTAAVWCVSPLQPIGQFISRSRVCDRWVAGTSEPSPVRSII
jgi:hypothetical protein